MERSFLCPAPLSLPDFPVLAKIRAFPLDRGHWMIEGNFDAPTLANMYVALDRICQRSPIGEQHELRAGVASAIECAKSGRTTLGALLSGERELRRIKTPEQQWGVADLFFVSLQGMLRSLDAADRFKRAVLVLRTLRRAIIDPVLRPNATPIAPCDVPTAFNSRSRLSSSAVHGLLLFFGMGRLQSR
jgi:hypothetical protein